VARKSPPAETAKSSSALTRVVVITGLSGSGKTSVAQAFEDLGYLKVDNLPLPLLTILLRNPAEIVTGSHLAVVADIRTAGFHEAFPLMWEAMDREGLQATLLFVESSEEMLTRRFSETRRPHPLAPDRPLIEVIREEREMLSDLRGLADRVIDTTDWNVHDVRNRVHRDFADDAPGGGLWVSITSFGFKRGLPYGSDMLFDVRFLDNPHFEPDLREQTGLDDPVRQYLEERGLGEAVGKIGDLLLYLLPRYRSQDRSYLAIGVGCTGGKHRSVASAEALARIVGEAGWTAHVFHRDVDRR
jgi:RNase adapter protein RapZ